MNSNPHMAGGSGAKATQASQSMGLKNFPDSVNSSFGAGLADQNYNSSSDEDLAEEGKSSSGSTTVQ